MGTAFITDNEGNRKAVIVPFDEWERLDKARDILEHVYLAGIIEKRKGSRPSVGLDELLADEGVTREELEG